MFKEVLNADQPRSSGCSKKEEKKVRDEINSGCSLEDGKGVCGEKCTIDPCVDRFFKDMGEEPKEFWVNLDMCIDKYMKESSLDMPLLGQKIYFLNKSFSKWVCVGLCGDFYFEPMVKLVGIKKQCVSLREDEWKRFVMEKVNLRKYFEDGSTYPIVNSFGLKISCGWFDGVRILKVEKEGEYLYLSYQGLSELWRLTDIVECHLGFLKSLEYGKYYKEVVEYLGDTEGDLRSEVDKMLNGVISPHTSITKELVMYGLNKMIYDVNFYRNIQA